MCGRTVNGSEQLSHWCSGKFVFLESSSMLNATPVTNAFLSYTWLNKYFFFWFVFSTSWLYFYFTVYLIMYWWKGTPCVVVVVPREPSRKRRYEEQEGLREFCLFEGSFCWAKKWTEYLILHFLFTLRITKNKIFGNVFEFRQQVWHWNVLIESGYWKITFQQFSFSINLNSFYVKLGEPLRKTSKL